MKKKVLIAVIIIFCTVMLLQGSILLPQKFTVNFVFNGKTVKELNVNTSSIIIKLLQSNDHKLSDIAIKKLTNGEKNIYEEMSKGGAAFVEEIYKSLDYGFQDSVVTYDKNGQFQYSDSKDGFMTDRQKAYLLTIEAVRTKNYTVRLTGNKIPPKKTREYQKSVTKKIVEFSTYYGDSSPNRKSNIELATRFINGVTVMPSGEFSFNAVVGERTVARGFSEGKIILDGEFIEGVGGGVCQVSTTLYGAWVRGGLGINKCVNHSLPVSYVPLFCDAMVSSSTDLKLINTSSEPIYIRGQTNGKEVRFCIYGKPSNEWVSIKTELVREKKVEDYIYKEIDIKDWMDGETERVISYPTKEIVGRQYRQFYINNTLVREELLRTCYYKPKKGIKVKRPTEKPCEYFSQGYAVS